ncbi:MaoC family dehydratase [Methylobacterium segetis]|uniref:MaoC family dehydratase n=1 Tax=Methylobacterium segetis TaxID=2488750 RepID=UPI0010470719|nr:MaoC family dehydratase [Methylobacterium segetis]
MAGIHFEDFAPGQVIESPPLAVSREEIVAFAREFDAQPFHVDEAAAKRSFVGTLIASGWHTAGLGMRLLQAHVFRGATSMGSPGINELGWVKPVLPGDAIRIVVRVEDCRRSGSRPDRGFVRFSMQVLNQRDETVMVQGFTVIFARRGAEPLPPRAVALAEPRPVEEPEDAEILPFLRDAEIGATRALGPHVFTADAITAFARAHDPQAFHLDAEAARQTHFGGLCASGWHTAAVWMKRTIATRARDARFTAERGPVPMLGPSPGFRDLRWLAPVYAGDTLSYAATLTEKRASESRPGWGLATMRSTARNQHGTEVFAFTGTVFWQWAP